MSCLFVSGTFRLSVAFFLERCREKSRLFKNYPTTHKLTTSSSILIDVFSWLCITEELMKLKHYL
jgi:hypothetical protein